MAKAMFEEDERSDLEQVIQQSAKEQLQLQKYVAHSLFQVNQVFGAEFEKLKKLEDSNLHLFSELNVLLREVNVRQKPNGKEEEEEAEEAVANSMGDRKSQSNLDFEARLTELEQLSREHMLLKSTLVQVERECRAAKQQVSDLQKKLQTLETELEHVKLSSAWPQSSHNPQTDSLGFAHPRFLLRSPDTMESVSSQCRSDIECAYERSITGLQNKLFELEKKYEMQVLRHEQLTRDMCQLRQQAANPVVSSASMTGLHAITNDHLTYSSCAAEISLANDNDAFLSTIAAAARDTKTAFSPRKQEISSVQTKPSSFQVFVAKYNYDPVRHSPNENPEAELTLNVGDYIFIYGDIDEDGFYDGELMNGKRGLVPSNFIEKVPDRDLEDYPASSLGDTESDSIKNTSYSSSGTNSTDFDGSQNLHSHKLTADDDLEDILEVDEDVVSDEKSDVVIIEEADPAVQDIPFPVDLTVERQLLNSLLISWSPSTSQSTSHSMVQSYSVYVDGLLKASVKAKDRTKALLEKVDLNRSHQISVRAVTDQGQSKDQQCIITVGKGVTAMPTDFQVLNITSMSAVLSWIPSNSNCEHVVHVNSRHKMVVKRGGYRCVVTGLASDVRHSASVQPIVDIEPHLLRLSKVTLSFKTLPSEIPDAPADVQIEAGPKQGTLLVMWLPVKPDGKPPNSAVTGYSVYVDGRRVKDLPSPTGDHVLLESEDFSTVTDPRQITIRATTATKESQDSSPISLTQQLLSEVRQVIGTAVLVTTSAVKELEPHSTTNLTPVSEASPQSENMSSLPQKQSHLAISPGTSSSQWSDSAIANKKPSDHHRDRDNSKLIGTGSFESGFSAQQLSPLEMKFNTGEGPIDAFNGYEVQTIASANVKVAPKPAQPTGTVPPYGTLPLIEVTKDNSGSFSDSSFDVDEPLERKRIGNSPTYTRSNTTAHHQSVSSEFNQNVASGARNPYQQRIDGSSSRQHGQSSSASVFGESYGGQEDVGTRRAEANRVKNRLPGNGNDSRTKSSANKPRIFIALFNYDPATMSPNPDGVDEELPFKEGQLIKILRDKDSDGFYVGEAGGLKGLVPSNMVSEVDDPSVTSRLLQDHDVPHSAMGTGASPGTGMPDETSTLTRAVAPAGKHRHAKQVSKSQRMDSADTSSRYNTTNPPRRMVALYSYEAKHKSPEANYSEGGELMLKAGDMVLAYGEPDKNGFIYVERKGHRIVVPSNYLRDVSPAEQAAVAAEKQSRHSSGPSSREPNDPEGSKSGRTTHDKMTKPNKHRTHDDLMQLDGQNHQKSMEQATIGDIRKHARQPHTQLYLTNANELVNRIH